MEADFAAKKVEVPEAKALAATIPVFFHVIQSSTSLSGGNVPYVLCLKTIDNGLIQVDIQ